MRPFILVFLASFSWVALGAEGTAAAPEPLALTSGWLEVIDVADATEVASADPSVALPMVVDHTQVMIIGGAPGSTLVEARSPDRPPRVFFVMVGRAATLQDGALAMNLVAGETKRVRLPEVRRLAVGAPEICEAQVTEDGDIELRPLRAGTTLVVAWSGGEAAKHRVRLLVTVQSVDAKGRALVRSVEENDAVLTEPLDGRLALIAGEQMLVETSAWRFAIADEQVATVRAVGRTLLVEGRAPGATRLVVWNAQGRPLSKFVVVHGRSPPPPPVWDPQVAPNVPVDVQRW
ncbi:MAG: pilus assembly protein N-terminal domain-containing protein [Myxococcaceae bacterium]